MLAFAHGFALGSVPVARMGLILNRRGNGVPVARMGCATTSRQFIGWAGAAPRPLSPRRVVNDIRQRRNIPVRPGAASAQSV